MSTEAAIARLGGHPLFLGANDIQLGVNETLHDTSVVISSMTSGIVSRVHAHSDVAGLAKSSSVPVINALSDLYHPLQGLADYLTIIEAFGAKTGAGLGLEGLKIAWVGDANNVLYDLAIGAMKLGIDVSVATPKGYEIPSEMREIIISSGKGAPRKGSLTETNDPLEAVRKANIVVTDTWVSMGQEEEAVKRMKAFEGFQITKHMIEKGGASEDWKFMHCLPRHPEEVADEVFYSPNSLVFQEAENRLWAAICKFSPSIASTGLTDTGRSGIGSIHSEQRPDCVIARLIQALNTALQPCVSCVAYRSVRYVTAYPGGSALASTISSASLLSRVSLTPSIGERGRAMRPGND